MSMLVNTDYITNMGMVTDMISPGTGDQVRPWIAAIILIVAVIVLIGLFVFRKKDDSDSDSQDEFEEEDHDET